MISINDRTQRQKIKRNKNSVHQDLTNLISLIRLDPTLKTTKYTLFSDTYRTFTKIFLKLGQKVNFNKFQRI